MPETKKCKQCQAEIDKKAQICPNCQKKQGNVFIFIIIGVLAVAIIGVFLYQVIGRPKLVDTNNSAANKTETKNQSNKPISSEKTEQTTFKTGETVESNDILVTLLEVKESKGSDFNKPSDGNVFVLCEYDIENKSEKDITISSMLSFEATCDNNAISQSITGLLEKGDKAQLDGSVATGTKMNGVIAYEVPTNWKELKIKFTPAFWSSKDITFIATK